jgi:hypothetical protein
VQALELLFRQRAQRGEEGSGWKYLVGLEMREIYNENIRDLLLDVSHATRHEWGQSADPRKVNPYISSEITPNLRLQLAAWP